MEQNIIEHEEKVKEKKLNIQLLKSQIKEKKQTLKQIIDEKAKDANRKREDNLKKIIKFTNNVIKGKNQTYKK